MWQGQVAGKLGPEPSELPMSVCNGSFPQEVLSCLPEEGCTVIPNVLNIK